MLLDEAWSHGNEWYPHWATALYTGMRNGELYALTWDKVDFENRLIQIDETWSKYTGFKATKSGDDRKIEINKNLLILLKKLYDQNHHPHFVLPRLKKWDKQEQSRELRKFLISIGLPPVRFHDLRATWATLLLSQGTPPLKVMSAGGWKDFKTMMIYVRKAGVDVRGMMDNLDLSGSTAGERRDGEILDFYSLS